jgi:glycosyltransferase involved in cell wall biosynthesis
MIPSRDLACARLLYLGFAFPPGVASLFPNLNPAGHALETQMIAELRRYFEIRSVGVLPIEPPKFEATNPVSGIAHDLVLLEKQPEVCHRLRSLVRLKNQYRTWRSAGWEPDLVLVYNLSPIYNQFIAWLRRQSKCPKLVLLLLDSADLGQKTRWLKQFRRRFKPMITPDAEMISCFDGCVGLSRTVEQYFQPRQVPFLWMPGGCTPDRALTNGASMEPFERRDQPKFGYFGALGAHAGVKLLVDVFLKSDVPGTLEICGYGKVGDALALLHEGQGRIRYHGLLTPAECLRFGRSCDVLINPRPTTHGNENNFASKLFEYALCGRAILTSRLSGAEAVLGPDAFYFDPHDFEASLREAFETLIKITRSELDRRGAAVQERIVGRFSWESQASRLASFLKKLENPTPVAVERAEALAA